MIPIQIVRFKLPHENANELYPLIYASLLKTCIDIPYPFVNEKIYFAIPEDQVNKTLEDLDPLYTSYFYDKYDIIEVSDKNCMSCYHFLVIDNDPYVEVGDIFEEKEEMNDVKKMTSNCRTYRILNLHDYTSAYKILPHPFAYIIHNKCPPA